MAAGQSVRRPRGSGVRGGLAGPVGENGLGERGYRWFLTPWGCVALSVMGATVGVPLGLLFTTLLSPLALDGHFVTPWALGARFWLLSEAPGSWFRVDFDPPMDRSGQFWVDFPCFARLGALRR